VDVAAAGGGGGVLSAGGAGTAADGGGGGGGGVDAGAGVTATEGGGGGCRDAGCCGGGGGPSLSDTREVNHARGGPGYLRAAINMGVVAVPKILLYYAFTPIADPEAVRLWQRDLCESLGLRGRILLSKDGINGTVGGDIHSVKKYIRKTREYAPFKNIEFKWSEGTAAPDGTQTDFPRLVVKVRDEIVSFGAPGELRVDENGVVGGGTKLSPEQLHELVAEKNVTFFDGRNSIEAAIGKFTDAIVPDVANTREFVAELESGKYDHLKNEPIVTYCTGGIRCEVLSSLMVNRGFNEVYQLDGGIVKYGEKYGDSGLWNGSLYVFDNRMHVDFTEDAEVIGRCVICDVATANVVNCQDASCRELSVSCEAHAGVIWCAKHSPAAVATDAH